MIIIEIKNGENLDRALKTLKSKVIKTRQNKKLIEKKRVCKEINQKKKSNSKGYLYTKEKTIKLIVQDFSI